MKYSRSKIMVIAHTLKKVYKMTFSEAQSLAWKNTKLKIAMHQGPVEFSYLKKDGTTRETVGTLHNIEHLLIGSDKFKNDILTVRYYDLEKSSFRSMKMCNLITVNI